MSPVFGRGLNGARGELSILPPEGHAARLQGFAGLSDAPGLGLVSRVALTPKYLPVSWPMSCLVWWSNDSPAFGRFELGDVGLPFAG